MSRAIVTSPTRARLRRNAGWLLFVALPTLLATLYYAFIASDLYASEARFVVHSPSKTQAGGLAGLLQGSGISSVSGDVYSVRDYLLSRDALVALEHEQDVRAVFARPGADFIARYPGLLFGSDEEEFYRYFGHRVDAVIDSTSSITTLTVKAFRADDAQHLAAQLLDLGEALVNRLNDRARINAVSDSEKLVADAEAAVTDAQAGLLTYRNREHLIDPGKSSGAIFEGSAHTQSDLNATRARLAQIERTAPQSPLRAELSARIDVLSRQVEEQRGRLAGGNGSFAPKISEYEQLMLRQEFATKELTSALASLESARAEARRQQIYLDRVVEPNLPDRALFPKRFQSVLIVFVGCFILYSIGALLLAGVREHAQT